MTGLFLGIANCVSLITGALLIGSTLTDEPVRKIRLRMAGYVMCGPCLVLDILVISIMVS